MAGVFPEFIEQWQNLRTSKRRSSDQEGEYKIQNTGYVGKRTKDRTAEGLSSE